MHEQILNAIKLKQVIAFYYEDHLRIVEPYCYGVTHNGNPVLRAFQVDGESKSNTLGWKLFDVSKINTIKPTNKRFDVARPGYRSSDKAMVKIFCEI